MPYYSSEFWEFGNTKPFTVYESTLPQLGFKIDSWKETTYCLCIIPTSRRIKDASTSMLPLYPFPDTPGRKPFKWRSAPDCIQANVEYTDISKEPIDMLFEIEFGTFYDVITPETVKDLWGPVPLERMPEGLDSTCIAATHYIVTGKGDKRMSVCLIHSLPLVLSAVQVY